MTYAVPVIKSLSQLRGQLQTIFNDIDTRITVGGGSRSFIDPHQPPYNAKGGARQFGKLQKISAHVIGDADYDFTQADVGKTVYMTDFWDAPNGRTVLSVSGGNLTIDGPTVPDFMVGNAFIIGYDDTAAIQAAIDAAQDVMIPQVDTTTSGDPSDTAYAHGARVRLRSGTGYIIRNPLDRFNTGKRAALLMPRRTGLLGGGKASTSLFLAPGSYGHAIANVGGAAYYSDFIELGHFQVFCNGAAQPAEAIDAGTGATSAGCLDGINISVAGNGYQWVEAYNFVHDVEIWNAKRDGFGFNGRGEFLAIDLQSTYAGRFGIFFHGQVDYVAVRCNAGGSAKTGIRVENAGTGQWDASKAYYSGIGGDTVQANGGFHGGPFVEYTDTDGVKYPFEDQVGNCANWHFKADNPFNAGLQCFNLHAQEARGSNFLIEGGHGLYKGCVASDPGREPIEAWQAFGTGRPTPIGGFHLRGKWCVNNIFSDCFLRPDLAQYTDAANWGYAPYGVYVEGVDAEGLGPQKNKGDIWIPEAFKRGDLDAVAGVRPTWAWTYRLIGTAGVSNGAGNQAVTPVGGVTNNTLNTKLRVNGTALT